jgi:hypothetical protein
MSYCDELHVGCNIDPLAVADPDAFLADLQDAYAELVAYA